MEKQWKKIKIKAVGLLEKRERERERISFKQKKVFSETGCSWDQKIAKHITNHTGTEHVANPRDAPGTSW